jgi:uncharacterized protein DUF4058
MKSPFPGMDPYLEAHWGDVHTSLITYARDSLQAQMPADLKVRVEENGYEHGYYPDIRVIDNPRPHLEAPGRGAATEIAVAEPLVVPYELELETQRSIQIIDSKSGNRIVIAIEILSPANKETEEGRATYRRKQRDLRDGDVNLVEIDLLRDGDYVMAVRRGALPVEYTKPYRICVTRSVGARRGEVYRVSLRERLPNFRIPLRETDKDAILDLQAIVSQAYENGGYDDTDYRRDPMPPLSKEDAVWADKLLREKGRR